MPGSILITFINHLHKCHLPRNTSVSHVSYMHIVCKTFGWVLVVVGGGFLSVFVADDVFTNG